MKLDIIQLVTALEEVEKNPRFSSTSEVIAHAAIAVEYGLIKCTVHHSDFSKFMCEGLTTYGREFLAAIRFGGFWDKYKDTLKDAPFELVYSAALGNARHYLEKALVDK